MGNGGSQLADFIKGRFMFVEEYCATNHLDPAKTVNAIKEECARLADSPEKRAFLEERMFGGTILASSVLPDWVDILLLTAMSRVLRGPSAPLSTSTSRFPCLAYEAGRFNARRQADTVFKVLYARTPLDWLKRTFPVIIQKCFGDKAAERIKVTEAGAGRVSIEMDNRNLESASPVECSTIIGYIHGALEKLGAGDVLVAHPQCGVAEDRAPSLCIFNVEWTSPEKRP